MLFCSFDQGLSDCLKEAKQAPIWHLGKLLLSEALSIATIRSVVDVQLLSLENMLSE